jgi:hypothetical protein
MCKNYGTQKKYSTEYNPQSNSIIERIHQTLGNALRTFELEEQELDEKRPWDPFLSATAWAIRSTYHTVLEATPGQLVFGRDMVLPIKFKADWARIITRKQNQINRDNARENLQRRHHEYKIGDQILMTKPGITRKMAAPRDGPFEIIKINTNGTVRIRRNAVTQTINIRRLTPFCDSSIREANDIGPARNRDIHT